MKKLSKIAGVTFQLFLKSINKSTQTVNTVYNLRLDNEHVYYANGYLVHNEKINT